MIASMIPKKIHYCWFGGQPRGELIEKCMSSWQVLMPDYETKRWDEGNFPLDNAFLRAAQSRGRWSSISNYARLHVLANEGGIYLDCDVEMLQSMTPLLNERCLLGFQQVTEQHDWVNTAVLAAEPGHAYLQACTDALVGAFERTGRFERSPFIATEVLRKWGLDRYGLQTIRGVTIYPVEYFYPYSWLEKYAPGRITAETYCIHYWAGAWKNKRSPEWPAPIKKLRKSASAWLQGRIRKLSRK